MLHPAESLLRIGRCPLASDVPKLRRPLAKIFVGESRVRHLRQPGRLCHLRLGASTTGEGASALVPSTCRQQPPTLQAGFVGPLNFLFTRCTTWYLPRLIAFTCTAVCPHLPHIESPESVPEGPAHKSVPFYLGHLLEARRCAMFLRRVGCGVTGSCRDVAWQAVHPPG